MSQLKLDIVLAAIDKVTKPFTSIINASKKLTGALDGNQKKLRALQAQQKKVQKESRQAGGVGARWAGIERKLGLEINKTTAAIAKQEARLKAISKTTALAANAKSRYDKTMVVAGKLTMAGAGAGMAGYMLARPMGAMLKEGMDFDSAMSNVQALTRLDATSDKLKELRVQARELGATTLFTSAEVAEGQAFLAMAGFAPDKIKTSMAGILDMAKAGKMDLGATADIGSNILTGMKLDAGEMGRVADVLTGAFTRSNTTLAMIGESMVYAAPKAAELGVSLETTAAMMGKLGDAGIQASMAGTGVRRMLSRMSAPNKAAAGAFQALGVSVNDGAGKLRDVPDILYEIYTKSRKLSELDRSALFKDIAGETGAGALSVLVDQAGAGELQKLVKELEGSKGEAAKVAATQANNLAGDLELLKSAAADVSIELMEGNGAALRDFVKSITACVSSVGKWIQANPELTASIVKVLAIFAGLLIVFGGAAALIGAMLAPFAMLQYAMNLLGIKGLGMVKVIKNIGSAFLWLGKAMMANPMILAIVLIVAALYLLWRHWDTVKAAIITGWNWIKQVFDDNPILNALFPIVPVIRWLIDNWGMLKSYLLATWEFLKSAARVAWQVFVAIFTKSPLENIKSAWEKIKGYLKGINLREIGAQIVQSLIDGVSSMFGKLAEAWRSTKALFTSSPAVVPTPGNPSPYGAPKVPVGKGLPGGNNFRQPVFASGLAGSTLTGGGGDNNNYAFTINAPAGSDGGDIARKVEEVLRRLEAKKARGRRASMSDHD